MDAATAIKLLAGAGMGALAGLGLSRIPVCSRKGCKSFGPQWLWMLAGAVFGTALAWTLLNP